MCLGKRRVELALGRRANERCGLFNLAFLLFTDRFKPRRWPKWPTRLRGRDSDSNGTCLHCRSRRRMGCELLWRQVSFATTTSTTTTFTAAVTTTAYTVCRRGSIWVFSGSCLYGDARASDLERVSQHYRVTDGLVHEWYSWEFRWLSCESRGHGVHQHGSRSGHNEVF